MFDDTSPFDAVTQAADTRFQRTRGNARCAFKLRDGQTVLDALGQAGSFKVRLPKQPKGAVPEAVLLNTAGGLTGGDRLAFEGILAPGAQAVMTTQASERAYRSVTGMADVDVRLRVGDGGRLDWLPQETILFDGAGLRRTLEVDLEGDAVLLAHETVVFGRTASGEVTRAGAFSDRWRVRRDGALIHADALRAGGNLERALGATATLAGAKAMSTILFVAPDAEARLDAVQNAVAAVSPADGIAGVSAWNGRLVARAVAVDGFSMRRIVTPLLETLLDGRGLPRVWSI